MLLQHYIPFPLSLLLFHQPLPCSAHPNSMVTTTDSASNPRKQHGEPASDSGGTLVMKISQMRKQIQEERIVSIKEKLERNVENLQCQVSAVMSVISKRDLSQAKENMTSQMLSSRINHPVSMFLGLAALSQLSGDKDHINNQVGIPTPSIKIPFIERLPPYTTWMHLARNEKMGEDQSIVGRRRIYYEQHGGEALVCSDSDEEVTETEEVKHEFSKGEDQLLWMAFEEHGLNEQVLNCVRQFVGGTSSEIQERYKNLKKKNMWRLDRQSEDSGGDKSDIGICLEKSLSAALDSFDNLFCRRCIQLFDCPLHGCSQPLIYPSEKQPAWSEPEGDKKPCSDHCYLLLKDDKMLSEYSTLGPFQDKKTATTEEPDGILASSSAEEPINQSTKAISQEERCFTKEVDCCENLNSKVHVSESVGKRKVTNQSYSALHDSTLPPDDSQYSSKKLKIISDDIVTRSGDYNRDLNLYSCDEEKHTSTSASLKSSVEHTSHKLIVPGSICHGDHDKDVGDGQKDDTNVTEFTLYNSMEGQVDERLSFSDWKPLEKELYLKGIEMFGRNSCLIARNLLSGLKTCVEVASYMSMPLNLIMDENGNIIANCTDQKMSRARMLRKRGKTRKFKYSFKSASFPSAWKRIAYGKNQSCKRYTPCECQGTCGKQCPCHNNGTCCEKYCGCSKLCKNRFRGCQCAKSQCRSRQCPCFAAGRECDPDVCKNCWVSCGDGSLGEPPRRGDGHCGNMRLLLRQRQRILLAKSDIAGWGAFIKKPVNKNDYLGEYTGELISHREADKRGKLYDRANSSFLFDLNDQLVLDACRKGDKLKFANHSYSPNCYAKVMLVAGDHRVGIFAKQHIDAGEELFYDYRYGPDQAPPWARKDGSKRDESVVPQGRARKHQSHS